MGDDPIRPLPRARRAEKPGSEAERSESTSGVPDRDLGREPGCGLAHRQGVPHRRAAFQEPRRRDRHRRPPQKPVDLRGSQSAAGSGRGGLVGDRTPAGAHRCRSRGLAGAISRRPHSRHPVRCGPGRAGGASPAISPRLSMREDSGLAGPREGLRPRAILQRTGRPARECGRRRRRDHPPPS